MKLYTFLFDYKGGTYISQQRSTSILYAIRQWASDLEIDAIAEFTARHKESVIEETAGYTDDDYGAVDTLLNVLCFDVAPCGDFGIIHIVLTSSES